jgi:hypothetical protein
MLPKYSTCGRVFKDVARTFKHGKWEANITFGQNYGKVAEFGE